MSKMPTMTHDLYVECPSGDVATQLRLLVTKSGLEALTEYLRIAHSEPVTKSGQEALTEYPQIAHSKFETNQRTSPPFEELIADQLKRLHDLQLYPPQPPDLNVLPPGSWFLQFTFTLAKPWLSKDNDPFYVAESVNPVRKDKVFKVPVMAASSWKGVLRWTIMHTRLALRKETLTPDQFAAERFAQALLFGDEKGEEQDQTKDFANYLDNLNPEARPAYESLLRKHFQLEPDQPLPHFSGRLIFYPTFFDKIDVEVINPHSRKTRAGTQPIYLECVPAGATGVFSLLYVPFDCVGMGEVETRRQAAEDLVRVVEGVRAMMLTYGFSAKRTSGYGLAETGLRKGVLKCTRFEGEYNTFEDLEQCANKAERALLDTTP